VVVNGNLKLPQDNTEVGLTLGSNGLGAGYTNAIIEAGRRHGNRADLTMPRGAEAVDTVLAVGRCRSTEESSRRIQFSLDGQFEARGLACAHSKREEKGRPSAQPRLAGVPLLPDSQNRSKLATHGRGLGTIFSMNKELSAKQIRADG
jgi:hypothetical protein